MNEVICYDEYSDSNIKNIFFILPRDRVFVNGVIRYDEYTDNEDNLVRATTILASKYSALASKYSALASNTVY